MELKLPYSESHLRDNDARGAQTKAKAGGFWTRRLARCRASLIEWEAASELADDREPQGDLLLAHIDEERKHARGLVRHWKQEIGRAETELEDIRELIAKAWS